MLGARRGKGGPVSLPRTPPGLRSPAGRGGGAERALLLSYSLPPPLPLLPLLSLPFFPPPLTPPSSPLHPPLSHPPSPFSSSLLPFPSASVLPRPLPFPHRPPPSAAGVGTEQGRGLGRVQFRGVGERSSGKGRFSSPGWLWEPGTEEPGVRGASARPHQGARQGGGGFGGGEGGNEKTRVRKL